MIAARASLMVAAGLLLHALDAGAQDVTLSTSSPCYARGESVSFVLTNSRDSAIHMPHIPVWAVCQTATDSCIAPAAAFDAIVSLDSHATASDSWNQRHYDGHVVGDGEYRIEVAYSVRFNPWELTTIATTFEISGSCPNTGVEGIQWHRFKNLFR